MKRLSEFDLVNNVFFYGRVTYTESLKAQESFDAFLCTSVKVIRGEDYALPSKIFDYITFQKPLLGFVTPGACHEFIKKGGLGVICNPDKPHESSLILEELIDKGIHLKPNKTYLDSFQRKNIAEKLAKIITDNIQKRT